MNARIRLQQTNPALGDLHRNAAAHLEAVDAAREAGAELVVFPELSLTGYFLKDQTAELALPRDAPELEPFLERSEAISIVIGFVECSREGNLYNALAFLEGGRLLHVHRKVHLVTYGMFEESRDFASGDRFQPVESRLGRFGLLTCEDLWHVPGPYLYYLRGVDAMLVASAGPARGVSASEQGLASTATWNTLLAAQATLFRTWMVYANRVGFEDGIGFGGDSCVYDPFGREAARLAGRETGELDATLDAGTLRRARVATPLRRDERPHLLWRDLDRIVRDGVDEAGVDDDDAAGQDGGHA